MSILPALAALAVDYYKPSHRTMYANGTEEIYSNFTPRNFKHFKGSVHFDSKMVNHSLQRVIKDYIIDEWNTTFFNQPLELVVNAYKRHMLYTLGEEAAQTEHIEALHKLGYLPIKIKALAEGLRVPAGIPVFTVVNTLPDFFWLTNYLESVISAESWKGSTIATIAYEFRRTFEYFAELTGANPEFIQFQAHDFSFRGLSGRHDAMRSNIGHLLSFTGTDTALSVAGAELWYNANIETELVGTSVPATEHSVMTQNIGFIKSQLDDLVDQYGDNMGYRVCQIHYGNMKLPISDLQYDETHTNTQRLAEIAYMIYLITELHPTGVISIVADSFDFWYLMEFGIKVLKPYIESRKPNSLGLCKVVFRPDSGDPADIICGTSYSTLEDDNYYNSKEDVANDALINGLSYIRYEGKLYKIEGERDYHGINLKSCAEVEESVANKGAMQCLYETFGSTTNAKGYKTLSPFVGLIYGDSITLDRQQDILTKLAAKKYATDCIILGIGSYTYQMISRDTLGFAMKATHSIINGSPIDIYKDPKTGDGTKKSAKGLLHVTLDSNGNYMLVDQVDSTTESNGELREVFLNGKLLIDESLATIRARLHNN